MNLLFQIQKMSESYSITNVYCAYLDNEPYFYPSNEVSRIWSKAGQGRDIPTGWQIIPNMLWEHVCTPKQWANMVVNYEAYTVKSMKCVLFNPVPITTNIAIQRTNMFAAFNNCTYCWGYTDNLYETSWHDWINIQKQDRLNLACKEGVMYTGGMGTQGDGVNSDPLAPGPGQDAAQPSGGNYQWHRYRFPPYFWKRPYHRTADKRNWGQGTDGDGVFNTSIVDNKTGKLAGPAGIFWDPLNRPDHINELRAGKNSMEFTWEVADCDENKWFNLDHIMAWSPWTPDGPYCGGQRPGTYKYAWVTQPDEMSTYGMSQQTVSNQPQAWKDYTVPNFAGLPIVPSAWWWVEMGENIADFDRENTAGGYFSFWRKIDKYYHGPETQQYKYPPCQWFTKGIPLFDIGNNLIRTSTQVACKITLNLEVKKRRSALYCPTWGPFAGRQLYHQDTDSRIFQPNMIRYRTGGQRRPWQNINRWQFAPTDGAERAKHPYEDPYLLPFDPIPNNTPAPRTTETDNAKDTAEDEPEISITLNLDDQRVTFKRPTRPPRRTREKSPERFLDVDMMTDLQQGP
uniref:Capsid protein n=1 Tax=Cygnus atratus Chaphamaparvovirus TaxID=2794485 RepID=A0A8A4XCE5_9VIRU|nr:MAG: capsid protein [Cygnus atratus Chaphamaparvovirus]